MTSVTNIIQNGIDVDVVKNILSRFGVEDEIDIAKALSRIEGNNLKPMIDYLQFIKNQ